LRIGSERPQLLGICRRGQHMGKSPVGPDIHLRSTSRGTGLEDSVEKTGWPGNRLQDGIRIAPSPQSPLKRGTAGEWAVPSGTERGFGLLRFGPGEVVRVKCASRRRSEHLTRATCPGEPQGTGKTSEVGSGGSAAAIAADGRRSSKLFPDLSTAMRKATSLRATAREARFSWPACRSRS